ncbi:MAG: carbohydrate-binding domain-containing protein, partial [Lentisphaerota bacterium]
VRAVDPQHIVIIEDGLHGFHRLPHPSQMGWENVVYSFHYYPQEIGEGVEADATLFQKFNRAAIYYGVPAYVGEFNTVKIQRGGIDTMLRYMQAYDFFEWPWTFWSYKKFEDNWDYNWGLYGFDRNRRIDFVKDSFEEILQGFQRMRTDTRSQQTFLPAALAQPARTPHGPAELPEGGIFLALRNAYLQPEGGRDLRMEWGNALPDAAYWGKGDRMAWPIKAEKAGTFVLQLRMANASPNVKVQVWLDGILMYTATIENPTGDWGRFELRNAGVLSLTQGKHLVEVAPAPGQSSFMNLRNAQLVPTSSQAVPAEESKIRLNALNMNIPSAKSPLAVEWLRDPMAIGYWKPGESASWSLTLTHARDVRPVVTYGTPNTNTVMTILIDGQKTSEITLPPTKEWNLFETINMESLRLPEGKHNVTVQWDGANPEGCGNLAEILLR